ncbi:pyruvate kinase [Candidatus Saccharibacteria bacterium TM7i]|nr:pyruvate kinase [Candidatus Saccharibacteria bacterium TM7i]
MAITFKRTKILATLGPSTSTPEMVEELLDAGVNGVRLNFSHGDHAERTDQIQWIREASKKVGKPVAILQDLQGPKIRLGMLNDKVEVKTGDEIILDYAAEHDGLTFPVQYNLAEKVKVGEPIYIFDGKVRTTVVEITSDTAIKLRVENNGVLMSKKGINLPDTDFAGDILTPKDMADIEYGLTQDIDYVALSFVQSPEDIHNLRQILVAGGSKAQIVAKIETKAAIKDDVLEEIVKATDGIMVARGDLAVEAGAEIVPIVQRRLIALCRKHGKLSIVATQMMASMVESPEPTRAEVGDVANAVIQGADAVMLSDETANGEYPLETVAAMKKVILYTQDNAPVSTIEDTVTEDHQLDAISVAAVSLAEQLNVDVIIAETLSGRTAATIAANRPNLPIISVTSSEKTAQQLGLSYANRSYVRPDSPDAGIDLFKELKETGFFGEGRNTVIIVSGQEPGVEGTTDTIKVRVLE